MLTSCDGISSYEADITRGSPMRTHTTDVIPQLDGPTSGHMRRRSEQEFIQRTTMIPGGGYSNVSDSDSWDNRRPQDGQRPSGGRRYHGRSGRLLDRGNNHDRGNSRRGGPPDDGGPPMLEDHLMMENCLMMEGPLMMEDPLIMEDPLGMEEIQDVLEDQDLQAPPGPPGPVRPVIVQQPLVTLDTTALENTFGTVGQSMLQLARAQDQTNRHLQQHLQQGQINMQAHTGALQQLATSTYQHNFDHIFTSISIYDGRDREGFFPWLECLEAACFYSG